MLAAAAAFAASSTDPAPIAPTSRRGRALQVPDYVDPRCAPPPPFKRAAFACFALCGVDEAQLGAVAAAATLAALLVAGRRAA